MLYHYCVSAFLVLLLSVSHQDVEAGFLCTEQCAPEMPKSDCPALPRRYFACCYRGRAGDQKTYYDTRTHTCCEFAKTDWRVFQLPSKCPDGCSCFCSQEARCYGAFNPPTPVPTRYPTKYPTHFPTQSPTDAPTEQPSEAPTESPSRSPSQAPTEQPSKSPTQQPTPRPTFSKAEKDPDAGEETIKCSTAKVTGHERNKAKLDCQGEVELTLRSGGKNDKSEVKSDASVVLSRETDDKEWTGISSASWATLDGGLFSGSDASFTVLLTVTMHRVDGRWAQLITSGHIPLSEGTDGRLGGATAPDPFVHDSYTPSTGWFSFGFKALTGPMALILSVPKQENGNCAAGTQLLGTRVAYTSSRWKSGQKHHVALVFTGDKETHEKPGQFQVYIDGSLSAAIYAGDCLRPDHLYDRTTSIGRSLFPKDGYTDFTLHHLSIRHAALDPAYIRVAADAALGKSDYEPKMPHRPCFCPKSECVMSSAHDCYYGSVCKELAYRGAWQPSLSKCPETPVRTREATELKAGDLIFTELSSADQVGDFGATSKVWVEMYVTPSDDYDVVNLGNAVFVAYCCSYYSVTSNTMVAPGETILIGNPRKIMGMRVDVPVSAAKFTGSMQYKLLAADTDSTVVDYVYTSRAKFGANIALCREDYAGDSGGGGGGMTHEQLAEFNDDAENWKSEEATPGGLNAKC